MMSQFTSDEFLNSFLEEAQEYLQAILRDLLALEQAAQTETSRRGRKAGRPLDSEDTLERINELLRALHSLKGISGMVGLTQAADLCHAMESTLKPIQQGQREISAALLDKLIEATRLLETVVQTVRDPSLEMPPGEAMIAQLQALAPRPPAPRPPAPRPAAGAERPAADADLAPAEAAPETLTDLPTSIPQEVAAHIKPAERKKIRAAFAAGKLVALATYEPTQQQIQEGKNVNTVREMIARHSTLIKAAPIIEGGTVRFVFMVSTPAIPPAEDLAFLEWTQVREDPPPPKEPAEEAPALFTGGATVQPAAVSIRVDLNRMDVLMQLVGDLVVTRSRISDLLPRLAGAPTASLENLEETVGRMERQVRYLRDAVMRVRLVPLSEVFARVPLSVRDLARHSGKQIRLTIEGGETEIDKALVERLGDPLMHLVRNAAVHGIEPPAERQATGKPAEGNIHIRGRTQGDRVVVSVQDDGRGIQEGRVRQKARSLGWLKEDLPLSDVEILNLLCRAGFSTLENADMDAGRGMGMNIVQEMIAAMGGELSLENTPGGGALFIIRLPLTLTIIDAFIIQVGAERYAVPQSAVDEVIEVADEDVRQVGRHRLLPYRSGAIPLISLQSRYHLSPQAQPVRRWHGLVVGQKEKRAAILVDRVLGLRETVVRPLNDPLITEPSISGATELGDGSIALILDCHELIENNHAVAG